MKTANDIRALIIDDEPPACETLRNYLYAFCRSVAVTGIAHTREQAADMIRSLDPDLVFLDVDMRGSTGFDLLQDCGPQRFALIFVTAHEQYAVKAFQTDAAAYILKPIDPDLLRAAVHKVQLKMQNDRLAATNQKIANLYMESGDMKMLITVDRTQEAVLLSDILKIEAAGGNFVNIVFVSQKDRLVRTTLTDILEKLPSHFKQVNKSEIVNMSYYQKLIASDRSIILEFITDGKRTTTTVTLARAYKKAVTDWFPVVV